MFRMIFGASGTLACGTCLTSSNTRSRHNIEVARSCEDIAATEGMVDTKRASIELWMHAGGCMLSTKEA
jgi:hypothetical protein